MGNKTDRSVARRRISIAYMAVFAGMLLLMLLVVMEHKDYQVDYGQGAYVSVENDWTDSSGNPVEMAMLSGQAATVYFKIPQMDAAESLVFRSQDASIRILVGEEILYETDIIEHHSFQRKPGSRWNIVTLVPEYSGKVLEMQVIPAYAGERISVDHIFFGDRAAIVLAVIRSQMFAAIVSVLLCLLGVVLIAMEVPLYIQKKNQSHSLLYLGMFSVIMGAWCLIETNILQFFVRDTQILQAADSMLLIVSVIPLTLYADCIYGILQYRIMRVVCMLDLGFMGSCLVLPVMGMADWHGLMPLARMYLAVFAVVFVVWVIREYVKMRQKGNTSVAEHLHLVGIGMLGISVALELVRYFMGGGMDRAYLLRMGLFFFILCFGLSSQIGFYKLVEQGKEYDIVKELAYSDGLTKLGNRTAYLEQLENCVEKKVPQLGIVFFDINNLKSVNDLQGHDVGDELIRAAAGVIEESFGIYGKVYRIGGDEFCVLLVSDDAEAAYEEAMLSFRNNIRARNESGGCTFVIQIAQGFAACDADSMAAVERAIKAADAKMYLHKAQLKA